MCQKRSTTQTKTWQGTKRVDKCMANLIYMLNELGVKTLACCCGHGVYNQSIVILDGDKPLEIISNQTIPRKRKFYKKDKNGYFYIPETEIFK